MGEEPVNCWQFFNCKGKFCPVYEHGRGRDCWNIGSMAKMRVSGATRSRTCFTCPWYHKLNK